MSIYNNYREHLCSVYKDLLAGFIEQKQALGFKFRSQIWLLNRFDKFTLQFSELSSDSLEANVVDSWVKEANVTTGQMRRRALIIHQFGEYMLANDKQAYLYPKRRFKAPPKYSPYIFSTEQIQLLFTCADTDAVLHPNVRSRVDTSLILRMLYGCGLRISEATKLKIQDVDLENGILRIYQSKYQKDRLVPMSASLTAACKCYADKHHKSSAQANFFFSLDGIGMHSTTVIYNRFRDLLFNAGIPHRGKGNGPRMHDLRHTFAVHSLKQLANAGTDLYVSLPILSTYLGHTSVSATQWYLQLTADVYPDMMAAVEKKFSDIYPSGAL